jgi:hypothetical protein
MSLFPIVFLIMLLLVAAMAIGVMFGREPIAGTCGGLNMMGEDGVCELCGGRPEACESDGPRASVTDLARDAMER